MKMPYIIALKIYQWLAHFVSPFNKKAAQMTKGQKETWEKLPHADLKACYWVHAPSLGEFEQGRPIIEGIKKREPNSKILLTFFSPSGYEVRKHYPLADLVCYLPFDSKSHARKFIETIQPKKVIFIKYDIWYFYLQVLNQRNIPAYLISAIFREDQIFFKPYGRWYKKALGFYTHIFVQQEASKTLLNVHGVNNCSVAGDTRFDRVLQLVKQAAPVEALEDLNKNYQTVVCGSTWPKDEDMLIPYMQGSNKNLKFIIAPHEIHEAHIQDIIKKLNVSYQRWSRLNPTELNECKVIIVDTIGLLSSLYRYADIAYIGGGFGVGIHNTLEAATYGKPVVIGPNFRKFQEAKDLIAAGGAFTVKDGIEFKAQCDKLLNHEELRLKSGNSAAAYVQGMQGATEYILNTI